MKYDCFPESCKSSSSPACLNITINCCCNSKPEPKPPKPCPPKPRPKPTPKVIINCGGCKDKSPRPPRDGGKDDCGCYDPYGNRDFDGEYDKEYYDEYYEEYDRE